jgi:lysozyme
MARKVTREGLEKIKQFEGLRLVAYQCSAGVWTIGYGSTSTAEKGMRITEAEAESLLYADLEVFESAVNRLVQVKLTDWQFAALVSFAFNVGVEAFENSMLLKKLNDGDYDAVPAQLMRWNKVKGKVVAGLTNRRAAEAGMWAKGSFVESSTTKAEVKDKPLAQSRTIAGSTIAGTMVTATAVLNETRSQLEPLVGYSDHIKTMFLIVALLGIGIAIYARATRDN